MSVAGWLTLKYHLVRNKSHIGSQIGTNHNRGRVQPGGCHVSRCSYFSEVCLESKSIKPPPLCDLITLAGRQF